MRGSEREHEVCGFTLVEIIVSLALLAMVSAGFLTVVTGSARVLSRGYRMDQHGYVNVGKVETQAGVKTGRMKTLRFFGESHDLTGELILYEYVVESSTSKKEEKYPMYYFDYK